MADADKELTHVAKPRSDLTIKELFSKITERYTEFGSLIDPQQTALGRQPTQEDHEKKRVRLKRDWQEHLDEIDAQIAAKQVKKPISLPSKQRPPQRGGLNDSRDFKKMVQEAGITVPEAEVREETADHTRQRDSLAGKCYGLRQRLWNHVPELREKLRGMSREYFHEDKKSPEERRPLAELEKLKRGLEELVKRHCPEPNRSQIERVISLLSLLTETDVPPDVQQMLQEISTADQGRQWLLVRQLPLEGVTRAIDVLGNISKQKAEHEIMSLGSTNHPPTPRKKKHMSPTPVSDPLPPSPPEKVEVEEDPDFLVPNERVDQGEPDKADAELKAEIQRLSRELSETRDQLNTERRSGETMVKRLESAGVQLNAERQRTHDAERIREDRDRDLAAARQTNRDLEEQLSSERESRRRLQAAANISGVQPAASGGNNNPPLAPRSKIAQRWRRFRRWLGRNWIKMVIATAILILAIGGGYTWWTANQTPGESEQESTGTDESDDTAPAEEAEKEDWEKDLEQHLEEEPQEPAEEEDAQQTDEMTT